MEEIDDYSEAVEIKGGDEIERRKISVFSQLKLHCLELLELLQNPKKHSSALSSLLQILQQYPQFSLQPFFDYTLFPLLLLLDAAVDSRSSKNVVSEEKLEIFNGSKSPNRVSDSVAEGVLQCLEELLRKCHLGSVEQMVVVLKKLTYGALLSPADASEEFREGIIKCFRALLLSLLPCSDESCLCKQTFSLPLLVDNRGLETLCGGSLKYGVEPDECLLAFFQSQTASAAVGHWLSLLLKAADVEAARGHRGSAKLRSEAFITLRVLVAKVGNADALAFFLPGVVSQFAKVLHASKRMASGAVGSVEALDQAIRGLAEFLMIVLQDDANIGVLDACTDITKDFNSNKHISTQSFMEELRHLPIKRQDQNKVIKEISSVQEGESNQKVADSVCEIGSLHVDRTKEWMERTSVHVDKLLAASFPHMCIHPAKKLRLGLLAAIQGLLLKCGYALKQSRPMLLECLCVLVVDESEEVSAVAQEFLGHTFFSSRKSQVELDLAGIFDRLIDKLPKVVFGSEESVAISVAQQLLVIMYYSGPQFVVEHLLQSPVTAAHFMDVIALCLSQNSVYAGSLNKLISLRSSSAGYVDSIAELKSGTNFVSDCLTVVTDAPRNSKIAALRDVPHLEENMQKNYELPRMPPWFAYIGSVKLYQVLSGILRLVGLSSVADFRGGAHLLLITEIPMGHLRKLVSEIRSKQYHKESWQSWYNRTGAGQLLRQGSTAACILNEIMYGTSNQAIDFFTRTFQRPWIKKKDIEGLNTGFSDCQSCKLESTVLTESLWKISQENDVRSLLIDCVGRILHEYLTPEVWDLPLECKSSLAHPDSEDEAISSNFFNDTAMLHQVIIEGIGIANLSLGNDFSSSGFLHLSLYLLLESLISSNYHVRTASDAVLHVIAATSGHPTVGHLVLANADYVIDSICRQLRHLDLNPHVPNVLAAMLSYIGLANKILPLLEEPMRSVSQELEILGRNQHPQLTIPFLKAVAEICKASKREAYSLPREAHSYFIYVHSVISDVENKGARSTEVSVSYDNFDIDEEAERWENIVFKLNDSKRYRRTVGSIAGSCSTAVTPLLASGKQAPCLVALDIVEDALLTLAKVEEAYKHERETKEAIEEMLDSCALYQLKDTLNVADEGADENRLLPAMNKIWPFLVICVQIKIPAVVRRCVSVVSKVVQICGGDFFSRRFRTDGPHFWKLLTTSPFYKKPNFKEDRILLQLPYRSISSSSEDSLAESSHLKVQAAVLNMIADLSRNKNSASALELVLKKVTGLVVGIACSGVVGLRDASLNALQGLASVDPDLVWLLLADVYYSSVKKKDLPSPPTSEFPEISQIMPPPSSTKEFLHVQYGGQSYGFDIDFSSVEIVFHKLRSHVFCYQMYS